MLVFTKNNLYLVFIKYYLQYYLQYQKNIQDICSISFNFIKNVKKFSKVIFRILIHYFFINNIIKSIILMVRLKNKFLNFIFECEINIQISS